jgi:molybdopterin synthase sulfur carrier subunit
VVKVLFFAALKEEMGKDFINLDIKNKTVSELKEILKDNYPNVSFEGVMTAINEEFAFDEDEIKMDDVVAFIPPVSGG